EADEVIIATDFDREGELIGVEALEVVKKFNPDFMVRRARFSSLTPVEIRDAFANLTDVDFNLSEAAECRQIIDLVWGAVLTRYLSLAAKQMGKDFLSAGRVQSPTLTLIVDREREIKKFTPEPYWEIEAQLHGPLNRMEKAGPFKATHSQGRFKERIRAGNSYQRASRAEEGIVENVDRTTKKERPPAPFNTTSFLRAAASRGLSPAAAMSIAEGLYNRGFISYPRTDNTVYPPGLDLREVLENLKGTDFRELAESLLRMESLTPTRGKKKATDHPPIYPSGAVRRSELSAEEWKVYDLVARRFMATLAKHAVSETVKVQIDINEEPFNARGFRILEKGWQEYYPYLNKKESILPSLEEGDRVDVKKLELLSKMTKPPGRYSQGGLIQLMDSLDLGTKSTRHEIIQKLYTRGYLVDSPPRATDTAYSVIDTLEKYSQIITKPDMTSRLEQDMSKIAEGESRLKEVVEESRKMLDKAMELLIKNRMEIRESLISALREQNTAGSCPECGKSLIIRQSRYGKRFIGCSGYPRCKVTYPLPQRGKILPTRNSCKFCGAPVVRLIMRKQRPREFCVNMDCTSNQGKGKNSTDR
ncbi:MAG: DNA topoisomerase I, partial [Thermoplasmata archaeon]|nr:DNA topoisomerase I [Thermoplasmata archaeon]